MGVKKGIILRIQVDEEDEQACGVVCQLLQCIYMQTDELEEAEEEYGCVAAFLPGWEGEGIHGPSLEDPQELVELPVVPFEDMGEGMSMEDIAKHLGEDQMAALMDKLQGLDLEQEIEMDSGGGSKKGKKK